MEQKSKIILRRKAEWLNRLRGYRVFIDGKEINRIKSGSSEEYPVEPGVHKIQCKLDWCSSREFDVEIKQGETSYLLVQSGMKFFWIFYILLITALVYNFYFSFSHSEKPSYYRILTWVLILPAFLYLLYYLIFARRDYLLITKDAKNIFAQ